MAGREGGSSAPIGGPGVEAVCLGKGVGEARLQARAAGKAVQVGWEGASLCVGGGQGGPKTAGLRRVCTASRKAQAEQPAAMWLGGQRGT